MREHLLFLRRHYNGSCLKEVSTFVEVVDYGLGRLSCGEVPLETGSASLGSL